MKSIFISKGSLFLALSTLSITILTACNVFKNHNDPFGRLTFNEDSARRHIKPADTLDSYINRFEKLRESSSIHTVPDTAFPLSETFNRDAILAILNAKGAKYLRIYLGQRPKDNKIVFCLYPANAQKEDIKVKLLRRRNGNVSNRRSDTAQVFTLSLDASSVGEGGEDGQRHP